MYFQQEKKLQNQFSFVERATQPMNNALKGDDVQTEPPPRQAYFYIIRIIVILTAMLLKPQCSIVWHTKK